MSRPLGLWRPPSEVIYAVAVADVERIYGCRACEVKWKGVEGSTCFLCGQPGEPAVLPIFRDAELAPYGWE